MYSFFVQEVSMYYGNGRVSVLMAGVLLVSHVSPLMQRYVFTTVPDSNPTTGKISVAMSGWSTFELDKGRYMK